MGRGAISLCKRLLGNILVRRTRITDKLMVKESKGGKEGKREEGEDVTCEEYNDNGMRKEENWNVDKEGGWKMNE